MDKNPLTIAIVVYIIIFICSAYFLQTYFFIDNENGKKDIRSFGLQEHETLCPIHIFSFIATFFVYLMLKLYEIKM